jgi:hypothetical protein
LLGAAFLCAFVTVIDIAMLYLSQVVSSVQNFMVKVSLSYVAANFKVL